MKGYVYVIKCKDENIKDCYIGSTINLYSRKKYHKCVYNNPDNKSYNYKVYKFIRDNGGFDNFSIEVIKEVEVENKKELLQYELEQYTLLRPSLNCNIPIIGTDKTTYQKKYQKQYQEKNKEYCKHYRNEYYNKNKDYHKKRYIEKIDEYKKRNNNRYKLLKTLLENHKNNIE